MRTPLFAVLVCLATACGSEPEGPIPWQDIEEVTEGSITWGVAPSPGRCGGGQSIYNLRTHQLVETACGVERRRITARPQDSADLRDALRGLVVVNLPCDGYDGTDTTATFRRANQTEVLGFAVAWRSCSGGSREPAPTITGASWVPVRDILNRVRAAP